MNVNDPNVQNDREQLNQPQKKRCHGNRRDQRFRRKYRARGMKPEKIEKLLTQRKQANKKKKKNRIHDYIRHVTGDDRKTTTVFKKVSNQGSDPSIPIATTTKNLNKRKRDISLQDLKSNTTIPKSTSSISIVQPLLKKMKKKKKTMTIPVIKENNNSLNGNYRRPMYLKRTSPILLQMLSKKLNYSLKKTNEQRFMYTRLNLLDRHYCLELDLQLWQSYLNIGQQQQKWPEQLCIMAQGYDFELCHQYLMKYIEDMEKQLNQYQTELTKQAASCSITSISFDKIDQCLKKFVDCQRKYLSTRNINQLIKFKDDIQESDLFEIVTAFYPTMDQNKMINQLITIREKQTKIWEELLQLEMRILCQFLPHNFDQLQNFITSITYSLVIDEKKAVQLNHERSKIIQEAKRTWLHISLSVYETKLQKYDEQYQEVLKQLELLLLNNTSIQGRTLFDDITRYMTYRTNQLKQDISNKISTFRRKLLQYRQRSSSTNNKISVSPEPYLDLGFNPFNTLEWRYLSLGPSCIRLNQSALRPRKQQAIQIKKEHKDISTKIQKHLVEYHHIPIRNPLFKQYSDHLLDYYEQCYFTPLPYKDHIQAKEQAQTTTSIRKKTNQHKLIIRVTDKSNNFYIGLASEFEKKVQKFFSDTNAFIELPNNPFNEILNKVTQLLNNLYSKKLIFKWQYEAMIPDQKTTELSHLYFNPKTHKKDIPVRPIENTIRASTTKISKFLDKIIRPIFDRKCQATTIIDGAHLIKRFNRHIRKGNFKTSTLFCTFDIHNLYTMLPQDEALNILVEFLNAHEYKKVKGIALDTIRKLASIVLKENAFVYNNKIYKQTTGGAMGSSFTLTLANIFMWKWQKEFVRRQAMTGEFFGRYIDDIFLTWNKSEKELKEVLDEANQWHPNIKLDCKISQSLPFLDVLLTNNNGILSTSVYHKPSAEPYVVPFISDHPRHVFSNIIQTAITRAVRYSSTFEAFNHERRYVKLMLLYNGYPSSFIDNQFQKFFVEHTGLTASSSSSSFLPLLDNKKQFFPMRHIIMGKLTPRQSQVAISADTANIDNDQTDDTEEIEPKPVAQKTEEKTTNFGDQLFVHYTHENRFQSFKRDMHQVYEDDFKNTPAMNLKLVVGNRNRRDVKNELIRKRPKPSILQNKLKKKRQRKRKKTLVTNNTNYQ